MRGASHVTPKKTHDARGEDVPASTRTPLRAIDSRHAPIRDSAIVTKNADGVILSWRQPLPQRARRPLDADG